jgi:integrase
VRRAPLRIAHDRAARPRATYAQRQRSERVPQAPLWRALLTTAARWGELTSATWLDLDAERLALTLRAATTTGAGRTRVIPLPSELVDKLFALRAIHRRVRLRIVQPSDRVSLSRDGADWAEYTTNGRRLLRRVLDRAGIARRDALGRLVDIHALRHTAATGMARRGVPLVVAQRVLGHASPEMTAKVYTHMGLEDLRGAVEGVVEQPRRGRKALG